MSDPDPYLVKSVALRENLRLSKPRAAVVGGHTSDGRQREVFDIARTQRIFQRIKTVVLPSVSMLPVAAFKRDE